MKVTSSAFSEEDDTKEIYLIIYQLTSINSPRMYHQWSH